MAIETVSTKSSVPVPEALTGRDISPFLWLAVGRPHILGIVFASSLTYSWIFTERFDFLIPLIAVWDWFIVNFMNRAADVEEDLANRIPGTAAVGAHKTRMEIACGAMIVLGLAAGAFLVPALLPFRAAFTLIGLAYNYRIIPHPSRGTSRGTVGWTRLKETYFFKNFGSSMLFTLSVFLYPLFGLSADEHYPIANLLLAIAFFIPLELTYEIIYDLRDVDGDKALRVPTYPAVHGPAAAKTIIFALLALSAIAPIAGALAGTLRLREWVVVAAVLQQLLLMRIYCRGDRLPTSRDCIVITWIGTIQLLSYDLWVIAGLPLGA